MFGTTDNISVPLPDSQVVMIFKIVTLGMVDMLILISVALSMKKRNKGMQHDMTTNRPI